MAVNRLESEDVENESTPEKKAKMECKLKVRVCVAEKQVQYLRAKIKELTQQQGVMLMPTKMQTMYCLE